MKIAKYCNETAQLQTLTGAYNEEGQPQHGTATTIACRKERSGKVIKDIDGQEYKATSRYFTPSEVNRGDLLDGLKVISAEEYKGRTGTVEGYEAYV
jgi:hypothetical protein